jgi:hypothetical protein
VKGIIRGLGVNRLLGLAVLAVALGVLAGPERISAQAGIVAPNQPGFGTIVVQKELVGPGGGALLGGDPAGFVFNVQPAGGTAFTLGTTDAMGRITVGVAPGNYTISEQPRPGVRFVEFQIGGVRIESFQVTAAQTITITAINEIQGNGKITITKQIVDANGTPIQGATVQGYQFSVTGPNNFTANLTSGTDGRASVANLAPGNYAVSETPPSGFILHAMAVDGVPVTNGQAFPVTMGQNRQVLVQNRMSSTPPTQPTQPIRLLSGCNNEALTWPVGTALSTVAAAVSPPTALMSVFKLDTATGRFRAYSPTAPAFANDYNTVETALEAVFLCVSAAATLNRPAP